MFQFAIASQIITLSFQENPFKAIIELNETEGKLNIIGKFENSTDDSISITYEMTTDKIGISWKTVSTQSGKYLLEPKSELVLAKVGLNIDDKSTYEIILNVFKDEELISADSLNYIPENH